MIKAVIFDLDGVLADTSNVHAEALNQALHTVDPTFNITHDDYLFDYGSLTTKQKIVKFFEKRNLPLDDELLEKLYAYKMITTQLLLADIKLDTNIFGIIAALKHRGLKLAVCSNANGWFVSEALEKLGIHKMFDVVLSNNEVDNPKPHPEMYLKCMVLLGVGPRECLVLEDSYHGVQAAHDSGANVAIVRSPKDLTLAFVDYQIGRYTLFAKPAPVVTDHLTILVPMAGEGSRFAKAGYPDHKPMIPVDDSTILGTTLQSLANVDAHYVFIVQEHHYENYALGRRLREMKPGCDIVKVNGLTEGAACTCLLAKRHINNNDHLIIINSDQLIIWDRSHLLNMLSSGADGGIVVFEDTNPKWSFAKEGPDGFVCEVAEKNPISNLATAGIYHWQKGSDFVKYAEQMIQKGIRVNNEFYTCPVYNEAIADGKKIKTYRAQSMWGLGTPSDLEHFLREFRGV